MTAARTGLWMANEAPLPYKRRLAYIKATGTQYIDTGVNPTTTEEGVYKIEVRSHLVPKPFHVYDSASGAIYTECTYNSRVKKTSFKFHWGNASGSASVDGDHSNKMLTWTLTPTSASVLELGLDFEIAYKQMAFSSNILLCANSSNVNTKYNSVIDRFNIITPSKSVRLIAVMSYDDEPCMYDEVSGQLFHNAGTGMFEYAELGTSLAGGGINV